MRRFFLLTPDRAKQRLYGKFIYSKCIMTMMCMLLAFSTVCSSVVYWQEVWLLILNIVEQWSYVVLKPLHTGYFVRGEGVEPTLHISLQTSGQCACVNIKTWVLFACHHVLF